MSNLVEGRVNEGSVIYVLSKSVLFKLNDLLVSLFFFTIQVYVFSFQHML